MRLRPTHLLTSVASLVPSPHLHLDQIFICIAIVHPMSWLCMLHAQWDTCMTLAICMHFNILLVKHIYPHDYNHHLRTFIDQRFFFLKWNTPGTRGWSRLRNRTLAVKSRKIARKSAFVKNSLNYNLFLFYSFYLCQNMRARKNN